MVTNLAYFFETAKKLRGGKWVWVKDGNGEQRGNVLLGGTILNPKKGFDHLYAAQLVQYTPAEGVLIFRSFGVKEAAAADATQVVLNGDGYSDAPEVGMLLMVAPDALVKDEVLPVYAFTSADPTDTTDIWATGKAAVLSSGSGETKVKVVENSVAGWTDKIFIIKTDNPDAETFYTLYKADGTTEVGVKVKVGAQDGYALVGVPYEGQSAKVTAVAYDKANEKFTVTLDNALGIIAAGTILVEAAGDEASASATVLVPNPNTFIEADRDVRPTEGYGITGEANISISTVYNKQAWIARMQPLPDYVLAKNKSLIDGIFWI